VEVGEGGGHGVRAGQVNNYLNMLGKVD